MQHLRGTQCIRRWICISWAQIQPRAVAKWKQNLIGGRAPLAATVGAAFVFYVKTTLHSDMLPPTFKLWGLGMGFLKILIKYLSLRRKHMLYEFCIMPAHAYLEQHSSWCFTRKSLCETQWKAQFFHKAFPPRCVPFMSCYLLLRLILFLPIY